MKKILFPVLAVVAFATLAFAGTNYFHTIRAEYGGFASGLGVGMAEPSTAYVLDVAGATRIVGVPTITGSPAITGNPSVVGYVSVSSASTSGSSLCMNGSYVTLPTAGTEGCMAYQTSDHKLDRATATGNGVWVAVH